MHQTNFSQFPQIGSFYLVLYVFPSARIFFYAKAPFCLLNNGWWIGGDFHMNVAAFLQPSKMPLW